MYTKFNAKAFWDKLFLAAFWLSALLLLQALLPFDTPGISILGGPPSLYPVEVSSYNDSDTNLILLNNDTLSPEAQARNESLPITQEEPVSALTDKVDVLLNQDAPISIPELSDEATEIQGEIQENALDILVEMDKEQRKAYEGTLESVVEEGEQIAVLVEGNLQT
jgi:hypothetical protein